MIRTLNPAKNASLERVAALRGRSRINADDVSNGWRSVSPLSVGQTRQTEPTPNYQVKTFQRATIESLF